MASNTTAPPQAGRPGSGLTAPVTAGVVAAVVGFSSSFVVVLAGLTAVGATPAQASSGVAALCVAQALGMFWLSGRHRVPVSLAWSTPGAALLASTGAIAGGWPAAVGAFVVTGLLVLLTALVPALGDLVARIPPSLARAMLAGVLLPLCIEPATALVTSPLLVGPVVLTWLVLVRLTPRWAVPAALAVAFAVVVVAGEGVHAADLAPTLALTLPAWSVPALVGVALPLYVVTMASQNVPGVAVMNGLGYRVPWRESLGVTGLGTVLAAPFGGHAVNLAAITAAMSAGPEAGEDRERRWVAPVAAGVTYAVLAVGCSALTTLVAAAPDGVVQAAAGLALLGTLASSLTGALAAHEDHLPAAVCLVVAASGVVVGGIGAGFWALVAGLVVRAVLRAGRPST
ncbi:benzoate/H(+) symporter BenE family transporter [Nocardioides bruguierae]|uniref:Benzoate/H(+) symporter BenE family transporter n=1 Tax=Nocardioides bruguierae TaxID=2945102 RepID=A0A9X2D8K2_9ACTN|nr:benzoate/H(+) symporter BenE family transporter [Nocardioides bruguierae]MCL8025240.1 benzoate/H(+) symporter BenE family transporter [Nocardioides bruguierae]MCM0621311.1 benzoate/H(+) symporter BenE family transporter [Nocardioides bruguierae]